MAEFKSINTQEEFDAAIKDRLAREVAKYADYEALKAAQKELTELKEKKLDEKLATLQAEFDKAKTTLADHDKIVSDLTTRATTAEHKLKQREIAHAAGIPVELAERINGTTEEEMAKDAELLAKFAKGGSAGLPPFNPEGSGAPKDPLSAAYSSLSRNLFKES